MTWGDALSLGLSPKDFTARFIGPGFILAALTGTVGSFITLIGCLAALQRKEEMCK